jgi:hypothetical protein
MSGFAVWISLSLWQAEEAVANLPLRSAVRVHCGQPSFAGYSKGTHSLPGYTGVLTPYSRGAHSYYGYTATGRHAARTAFLSAGRAFPRSESFSCRLERVCAAECPKVSLQGLELLVTVLLTRNRQPTPTVAAGVPHANLAAELILLPSGLLAMVCEAIVALKVRLGTQVACACVGRRICTVLVKMCVCVKVGKGAVLTTTTTATTTATTTTTTKTTTRITALLLL